MNRNDKSDVIVVGGVAAGPKTAATLVRRLPEIKITLFEKGDRISYAGCGLPYFASGDINSFDALTKTVYGVTRDIDYFRCSKGFEVVTGARVMSIDRENKSVMVKYRSGSTVAHGYDKLVLTTGGKPKKPAFPVTESKLISTFTRPDEAIAFRQAAEQGKIGKVVIVGGGYIGCEMAEAAAGLWGIETVLLEREKQLLPSVLDAEMSHLIKRELEKQGISVLTGVEVTGVELNNDGMPLVKMNGNECINADYVFLCLGIKPEVTLAMECGLEIGLSGGIKVDKQMRTSDHNIYAGGDCVELVHQLTGEQVYFPMGSLANRHGRVIAENIAGHLTEFPGVLGAFFVKVFELNVGAVGLTEVAAAQAGFKTKAVWASFPDKPDYYPEVKTLTLKMVYSEEGSKLLGLQAIGSGDICRRVDLFSSMLQRQAVIEDLLDFENGYAPPYAEPLDPLHQLAALAKAIERGAKIISFAVCQPDEAEALGNIVWLDVREIEEAAAKPWPIGNGSLVNIPLNDLRERLQELDSSRKTMIICGKGPRAYQAALFLQQAGFNDVHIIGGGVMAALA